jgi:hypothetical protein
MANSNDIHKELKMRIEADLSHFHHNLPERTVVAWHAYLAGLIEWDVIPIQTYDELIKLLPALEDDPSISILLGRE